MGKVLCYTFLQPLPRNLFIIAACNPHRGHSLVTHEPRENIDNWIKGTYYVNKLHPSIQCLIWKYGALDERQEHKYIHEKMAVISKEKDSDERYILWCIINISMLLLYSIE